MNDIKINYFKNKENLKIIVCINTFNINYMLDFIDTNDIKYISIDFEYNRGRIRLAQFCINSNSIKYIFIFDPRMLDKEQENKLINILSNEKIKKILHGSETLDLPYILLELIKDKNKNIKFINSLIDTRMLCEYNKSVKQRCSIYYALLNADLIDPETYNKLDKIEASLGPNKFKIDWTITKLSDNKIKYALYDVYYLEELYNINQNNIITDLFRLTILNKYYKILDNCSSNIKLNIYDKNNISKIDYTRKTYINLLCNYKKNKNKILELFNKYNLEAIKNYFRNNM
jgi:ribonuclease D